MAIKGKQPEEPRKPDEASQPGGVYVVNGRVVDATGEELEGWAVDSEGNAVKVAALAENKTPAGNT